MKKRTGFFRLCALLTAAFLLCFAVGCADNGGTVSTPSGESGDSSNGVGDGVSYSSWDDTFWLAATSGLSAINTEAQMKRAVKNTAEAGINMMLWLAGDNYHCDGFLEEIEKYDLYAIIDGRGQGFSGAPDGVPLSTESEFAAAIEPYAKNPRVVGFINIDEPLYEDDFYSTLKLYQDWTRKYAPGKISFINLLPSYGPYTWGNEQWPAYVDELVEKVGPDVMSTDYYEFSLSGPTPDFSRSSLWRDLGYLRQNAVEEDIPLWFYIQGCDFSGANGGPLNVTQLAIQLNAGLAYGCRWLCYWTTEGSILDGHAYKSALHAEVTALNKKVMAIGNYLFDKELGELYHAGLTDDPERNKLLADHYYCNDPAESEVFTGLPNSDLILTTFTDEERTYVTVVNRTVTDEITDTIQLLDSYTITRFDPESGEEVAVGEGQNTLSVTLAAGDIAVFALAYGPLVKRVPVR